MEKKEELKPVIGLEIHVQLRTLSKMFCSCINDSEEIIPNKNICPICLGHPGTLPTANAEAVYKVIKMGLALGCRILLESEFARKSYFYPDLPKGYQISQAEKPLCAEGIFEINKEKEIRIKRIHLEEDTARLIHNKSDSLVDFNRAGMPLMELVTEPDFSNGQEVDNFVKELHLILRYLKVSNADMEKGEMRIEANVSVQLESEPLGSGVKVELKNLNSLHAVREAIDYEISRQSNLILQGNKIDQETRGWDGKATILQRKKEVAQEYRYFPEPDLLPMKWTQADIDKIRGDLPELPKEKRIRFVKEYQIDPEKESQSGGGDAELLIRDIELGNYFEKTVSELFAWMKDEKVDQNKKGELIKLLINYLTSDLKSMLNERSGGEIKITPENFAELIILIFQNKISSRIAKDVLKEMFENGGDPSHIIEDRGLAQIDDQGVIKSLTNKILKNQPELVNAYKQGKTSVLQFLIGQLMKETGGRVEPGLAKKILEEALSD